MPKKKELKRRISQRSEATLRQKIVFSKLMEGKGSSMKKILKEAGYSESVQNAPTKVTKSKTWQDLMEQYLPDDQLAKIHNDLLNKKENIVVKDRFGGVEIIPTGQVDTQAAKAALEMAYKLKGKNKEDNEQRQTIVNVNIERAAEIKRALEDL